MNGVINISTLNEILVAILGYDITVLTLIKSSIYNSTFTCTRYCVHLHVLVEFEIYNNLSGMTAKYVLELQLEDRLAVVLCKL